MESILKIKGNLDVAFSGRGMRQPDIFKMAASKDFYRRGMIQGKWPFLILTIH